MKQDLVPLVADKDMEYALRSMLERTQALQIRSIKAEFFVHPQHDPACARQGVAYLSPSPRNFGMACSCSIMKEAEERIRNGGPCSARLMANSNAPRGAVGPAP